MTFFIPTRLNQYASIYADYAVSFFSSICCTEGITGAWHNAGNKGCPDRRLPPLLEYARRAPVFICVDHEHNAGGLESGSHLRNMQELSSLGLRLGIALEWLILDHT